MEDPPFRKVSHEKRLEIAERICTRILETFKEDILEIFITGSTAKALDRPFSDLEMTAIVRDSGEIPTRCYVYDGLLVQIDYRQGNQSFSKRPASLAETGLWGPMSAGTESYCLNEAIGRRSLSRLLGRTMRGISLTRYVLQH